MLQWGSLKIKNFIHFPLFQITEKKNICLNYFGKSEHLVIVEWNKVPDYDKCHVAQVKELKCLNLFKSSI